MKILILDNSGLTSNGNDFCVDNKTGEFAKELLELDNDVTFFGQKFPQNNNTNHTFKIKENGISVKGLFRKNNKIINYFSLYLNVLPEILKSDFIYFFYPTAFKFLPFIVKIFGKKYGVYIRGMKDFDSNIAKMTFKNASVVLTVSDIFTNYINANIKKIANTIRPMMFYSFEDIINNKNLKKQDTLQILFLGRLDKDKGLFELVNAMNILKIQNLKIHLNIVGVGEYLNELKELIKKYNLENYITYKGAVYGKELIKNEYMNANVYILPTYHEGFPRTLYESMIYATPIITTFVGGIPSLMKSHYNCLEIKSKSIDSIVEAIVFANENYEKMIEFAKNGTITIQKVLDPSRPSHAKDLNNRIKNI